MQMRYNIKIKLKLNRE